MKRIIGIITVLALFAAVSQELLRGQATSGSHAAREAEGRSGRLTRLQLDSLILAIQDEVYDYRCEKQFYRIGVSSGTGTQMVTKLRVYIRPDLDQNGAGEMIYKDMPYGEILRVFHFRSDGLAVLDNDPELGFPITEPSHLTLFMDDDEVIRDKQTWVTMTMEIADTPPMSRVVEAAKRQQARVGFSAYLSKRHARD